MLVRTATEDDLAPMPAILNEVIRTSTVVYTKEATLEQRRAWHAARVAQGYLVLVAADPADGAVLGHSSLTDFRPWPGYRHTVEHSDYVRADVRGQGVGAALAGALFGPAAAMGKHVMVAGINAANPASIRLHQRLGFEPVGRLREVGIKSGRWLDLIFTQRFLDAPGRSARGDG